MSETIEKRLERLAKVERVARRMIDYLWETDDRGAKLLRDELWNLTMPCAYCESADDGTCEVAWDEYNIGCGILDCLGAK